MDKKQSIESLQFFVTHLAEGAIVHKQQGMIFKSQGFTKLGEKYIGHFNEEMGWVEKFTERILDLGGTPLVQAAPEMPVITDPVEYIKSDVAVSRKEVPVLMELVLSLQADFNTYEILRAYALDEEEDMLWSETQLDLIGKIGLQNWLVKQL